MIWLKVRERGGGGTYRRASFPPCTDHTPPSIEPCRPRRNRARAYPRQSRARRSLRLLCRSAWSSHCTLSSRRFAHPLAARPQLSRWKSQPLILGPWVRLPEHRSLALWRSRQRRIATSSNVRLETGCCPATYLS